MGSACVSVIVPVYKVEPYLDRCVKSVVEQTYRNLEIILVDDGSPDNCPAMCDAWAEKDGRIKVIHKANGGLSDARNAGMLDATGEYFSFVDSDDWIAPEMLERLVGAMERDGSDIAACAVKMVWENGNPDCLLTVQTNKVLDRRQAQEALLRETLLKQPVWYKLYKKELVSGILFPVGKYHEDVFWSYQAIGNAARVSIIDYVGYFYFQRAGSIMGEGYSLKRLDAVEAVANRYQYIAKCFPELEKRARVSILTHCIYHGQMAMKFLSKKEQRLAFNYLLAIKSRFAYKRSDYSFLKPSHHAWIDLARVSLHLVCFIKNIFGVGI